MVLLEDMIEPTRNDVLLRRPVGRVDVSLEETNIGVGFGGNNEGNLRVGVSGPGQVSLDRRDFLLEGRLPS